MRKLHNKDNSTNCQNTEKPPQTQQYKQDEETEEYPAGKAEQDKCPPNQTKEEEIGNIPDKKIPNDSENDPKSWNENGITDK